MVHTHCADPGRMEGLVRPGMRVWVSRAPQGTKRKLKYTWEIAEHDGVLVGVNTHASNRLVGALLEARKVPGLTRFDSLTRERPMGDGSRVDFLLVQKGQRHWVEVKNCQLVYPDGRGYFPDSVSKRAAGHLAELRARVDEGDRATVLFTVLRGDAKAVRPSDLHDPDFARALREAKKHGVRLRAIQLLPTLEDYRLEGTLPVDTRTYATKRHARWREEAKSQSGWKRRGPV